jgi:hypothetical protein
MRAYEFINESVRVTPEEESRNDAHTENPNHTTGDKEGKLSDVQARAMPGVERTRDTGGYDRIYHLNRLSMALAGSDGKSSKPPEGIDGASWAEKYNTIHPYTDEEHQMVKQAMKVVPSDYKNPVKDRRSREAKDTYTTSPSLGFKGWN